MKDITKFATHMTEGAVRKPYTIYNKTVAMTCYLQLKLYFVEKIGKLEESKSLKPTN